MAKLKSEEQPQLTGILLVNKPAGRNSFWLVRQLRRLTGLQKVGHAGTLDPFATGVMVMLLGREYTRLSGQFLNQDKEYSASLQLGSATETFDIDGAVTHSSTLRPSLEEVTKALELFQGWVEQVPPMYSAKKIDGKRLYELARQGREVARKPAKVHMRIELIDYSYPRLDLKIACSKGTYIRSLADDLGRAVGCYAHLKSLERLRSGPFDLSQCLDGALLELPSVDIKPHLSHAHAI